MLPQSDDDPARLSEHSMVFFVAFDIPSDFHTPERRQCLFPLHQPVAVPKVAVDEDCDSGTSEYDIRVARELAKMFSESKSSPVKLGPYPPLNTSILSLDSRHAVAALLCG